MRAKRRPSATGAHTGVWASWRLGVAGLGWAGGLTTGGVGGGGDKGSWGVGPVEKETRWWAAVGRGGEGRCLPPSPSLLGYTGGHLAPTSMYLQVPVVAHTTVGGCGGGRHCRQRHGRTASSTRAIEILCTAGVVGREDRYFLVRAPSPCPCACCRRLAVRCLTTASGACVRVSGCGWPPARLLLPRPLRE